MTPAEIVRVASEEARYLVWRQRVPLDFDDVRQEACVAILVIAAKKQVEGALGRIIARRRIRNYAHRCRMTPYGVTWGDGVRIKGRLATPAVVHSINQYEDSDNGVENAGRTRWPAELIENPALEDEIAWNQIIRRHEREVLTHQKKNPPAQNQTRQAREEKQRRRCWWYTRHLRPFDLSPTRKTPSSDPAKLVDRLL